VGKESKKKKIKIILILFWFSGHNDNDFGGNGNGNESNSNLMIESPNFHILHTNPHIKVTAEVREYFYLSFQFCFFNYLFLGSC
jgi:hypothetical protein